MWETIFRDFGYVSRNPVTQRHQCHIFRCDIAAVGLIQCMLDNHEAHKKLIKKIGMNRVNRLNLLD